MAVEGNKLKEYQAVIALNNIVELIPDPEERISELIKLKRRADDSPLITDFNYARLEVEIDQEIRETWKQIARERNLVKEGE